METNGGELYAQTVKEALDKAERVRQEVKLLLWNWNKTNPNKIKTKQLLLVKAAFLVRLQQP